MAEEVWAVEVDVALSRPPAVHDTRYALVLAAGQVEAELIGAQLVGAGADVVMAVGTRSVQADLYHVYGAWGSEEGREVREG